MWEFGLNALIQIIAATLTLLAIITSLYLATKSKTLKYGLIKEVAKDYLLDADKPMQKVVMFNTGHTKFTITQIGYVVANKYYFCLLSSYLKKTNEKAKSDAHNHILKQLTEMDKLPTYLNEGECIELYLYPKSFNFVNSGKNKKVYYFVVINNKVKKFCTGLRENKFYEVVSAKKTKADNMQKGDETAKRKLDLFFRC